MKTVSVIIPVYNSKLFLRECVESVLQQDYKDVEIIIVDDGSTDGSLEIATKLAQEHSDRIKLLSLENGGVSAARNAGLEAASGKYVFFIDSDDKLVAGSISRLLSALESDDECDIAVGFLSDEPHWKPRKILTVMMSSAKALEKTLYQRVGNDFSVCGKLYRRSLFEGSGAPRFKSGRRFEDLEITPRIYSRARKIAYIDSAVYYYRVNNDSFIHTWSPARADALWAVDTVMTFIKENNPELVKAALSRRFSAYYNIFRFASRYGDSSLSERCFREVRRMSPEILKDRKTRMKNKLGALVAIGGKRLASFLVNRSF